MHPNRLNLEDFPNSAYAHELRRGASTHRFEPLLEAEYREAHLLRVRLRARIWYSVSTALALLFAINNVRRAGAWSPISLAHLGALVPCTAALAWLVWGRWYERLFLQAAPILVTAFGALVGTFIAFALVDGKEEQLAALTVNLVGIFFFAGLMYRQALFASAALIIVFAVAARAARLPPELFVDSMVILMLTGGICAIVYRDVEHSYRRSFLEDALIGELVARDALSALMNRRAFDEHLQRVWQHAMRDERSIAVLMIDIDHFKRYNDTFGHQAGDAALRGVAGVIQDYARRPLDLAARYGGEEFAIILYDLTLPHVRDIAERLCAGVRQLRLKPGAAEGAEVTVSVGVGWAMPTIGRTPQGVVQLADEALYVAKHAGRDRIAVKGADEYLVLDTGAFNARKNSGPDR